MASHLHGDMALGQGPLHVQRLFKSPYRAVCCAGNALGQMLAAMLASLQDSAHERVCVSLPSKSNV